MNSSSVSVSGPGLFDIAGKRAVVSGASRGIGRAIAVALAQHGAHVLGVARSEDGLGETAELAKGASGSFDALSADLLSPDSIEACIAHSARQLGGIDILVNNAADDHDSSIEKTDLSVWRRVMDLNLQSGWLMMKAASPYLKDGGGSVINIASVLGLIAVRNDSAYIAAKHGLIGATRAIALEWARTGVRVNAIAPGYVQTAMLPDLEADQAAADYIRNDVPMGRWSQPEEYAGPTIFLASKASGYVTGQVLVVDGGVTVK
jgi:NAD(P)-dependent dehydrogenase (short-subunit alcohol dehydrogenase family)